MPDEPRLPTKEELSQLPRWAVVAFAARCARRVQPLYKALWPDAPPEHVSALDIAITRAERAASAARIDVAAADFGAFAVFADAAAAAARADATADIAVDFAARAAASAARAAARIDVAAADFGAFANADFAAGDAAFAVFAAADAAAAGAADARDAAAVAAMRRDLDQLFEAARRETWTGETPVPPEFFGPLWPGGEPEGWPYRKPEGTDEARTARPPGEAVIEVYIDPGEASKETIQAVLEGLGDLHRAAGGLGLEFHSEGLTLCAWEGVRT